MLIVGGEVEVDIFSNMIGYLLPSQRSQKQPFFYEERKIFQIYQLKIQPPTKKKTKKRGKEKEETIGACAAVDTYRRPPMLDSHFCNLNCNSFHMLIGYFFSTF